MRETYVRPSVIELPQTAQYGVLLGSYIGGRGEDRPDLLALPVRKKIDRLDLTDQSTFFDWIDKLRPVVADQVKKSDVLVDRVASLQAILDSLNISLANIPLSFKKVEEGKTVWELQHHQSQLAYIIFSLFCYNAIELSTN